MAEGAMLNWTLVGGGMPTNFTVSAEGPLHEVRGPEDVLALCERSAVAGWDPPVILIHEAGGTTVGPLLGQIAGVVSTKGTLGAHVALLAKEYGCPCIVGARLDVDVTGIDRVRLDPVGSVWTATENHAETGAQA